MKLTIVRHGETNENVEGIFHGHFEATLSEDGLEQIDLLAKRLRLQYFNKIYSSDLDRAKKTAQRLKIHHPTAPISYLDKLREKYCGEWEGKTMDELGLNDPKYVNKPWPEPKDGETIDQIMLRAKEFYDHLKKTHEDDNILVVAHGGFNTALIANIMDISFMDVIGFGPMHNTSVYEFEINNGSYKTLIDNCIKHLE
ncbi:histidine phosphatase family protein [Nanoarchaeota archaeon]